MINCDNGKVKVIGDTIDVSVNFLQIVDTCLEIQPEIVISVLAHRAETLENKTDNANHLLMSLLDTVYDKIDKGVEDNE